MPIKWGRPAPTPRWQLQKGPSVNTTRLFTCTALAGLAVTAGCSLPGFEADIGFMQSQLSGDLRVNPVVGGLTVPTQSVAVQDDLGLNDPSGSLYGRAELDLTVPHLTISGFTYNESGSGVLNAAFGDIVPGVGVSLPVRSESEINNLKGALTFDIGIGPVRVSPGVAVSILDVDLAVTDLTGTFGTERFDETLPVPLLFVQTEVDLGIVSATVDAGALDVEVMDVDGTFVDVEALLKVHPADHFDIFIGYRLISADISGMTDDNESFDGDLTLQGWMIGGGITF